MGAPENYSQWLSCFERMKTEKMSDGFFEELSQGTCPSFDTIAHSFCSRLTEAVNAMLSGSVKRITRQINNSIEDSEIWSIETILRRGRRELNRCFFFRKLGFLPDDFVGELTDELNRAIKEYWNDIYKYLSALDSEAHSQELSDLLFLIKRMD